MAAQHAVSSLHVVGTVTNFFFLNQPPVTAVPSVEEPLVPAATTTPAVVSEAMRVVMSGLGPGSKARAWAGLCRARASQYLKPGPSCGLGPGSGGLGPEPGLWSCDMQIPPQHCCSTVDGKILLNLLYTV